MRINLCNVHQLKCFPHVFSSSSSCENVRLCFAEFQHFFGNIKRLYHGIWRIYQFWVFVEVECCEVGEESNFFRQTPQLVVEEVKRCEVGEESNFWRNTCQLVLPEIEVCEVGEGSKH